MYNEYGEKDEVVQLFLDDIIPNRFQPREVFDEKALKELAVSIKEHGVIQPIIVRNVNGKYEIIAGERRYKASALAGLTKIPAIIRNLDDKESSKVALLENLQRKNLNPIEEARTYQKILELDEMTQEDLAKTMGKSQSSVANKIRLLSLSEEIQNALLKEQISERHARALLTVPDQNVQKELMNKVISSKMSVRALEEEIEMMYPKGKAASEIPIDLNATAGGFLNNTPLTPTSGTIEEDSENYGKVVIAPPTMNNEEQQEEVEEEPKEEEISTSRFVNYGEIGKDTDTSIGMGGAEIPATTQTIDVNEIRQNAQDIKPASGGTALDNMLNISAPASPMSKEERAQKADYFSMPDLPAIKIDDEPTPIIPNITNVETENTVVEETPVEEETSTEEPTPIMPEFNQQGDSYTLEEATEKIKQTIEDLKAHGINVTADEMNFPKSYQMIIKIDKE